MKCWLSLDRWFDSGSKEFGFKFGTHVSTFSSYFVLPDKKKATCQDPNLSRYATEGRFHIRHHTFDVKKRSPDPRRDLNTQPSDLESDALPLRHEVSKIQGGASCVGPLMHSPQKAA